MSSFSDVHTMLHHSQVGKAIDEVRNHPKRAAVATKIALALA